MEEAIALPNRSCGATPDDRRARLRRWRTCCTTLAVAAALSATGATWLGPLAMRVAGGLAVLLVACAVGLWRAAPASRPTLGSFSGFGIAAFAAAPALLTGDLGRRWIVGVHSAQCIFVLGMVLVVTDCCVTPRTGSCGTARPV